MNLDANTSAPHTSPGPRSSRAAGFTLIELMVTVVILAVLATVAVVSYRRYAAQARTQEAISFLLEIKLKQETYFATYGQYATTGPIDTWYPTGDVTNGGVVGWDMDCTGGDAIDQAWCSLGVRPSFQPCPSTITAATGQCSYHQFYSAGWFPGTATVPDVQYVKQPNRPWWYALAQGDVDANGVSSLWLMSSELTEPYNLSSEGAY